MTSHTNPAAAHESISNAAALCLAVSAVAASGLAAVVLVDLATPLEPVHGMIGLLAAVCSVFGIGYISRSAEDRIGRREAAAVDLLLDRIEQLEKRMDAHAANLGEQGAENYASAYVAGAGGRRLTAVPGQG